MSEIVELYIEKVERLRQSRSEAVTEADLREIARDLGLSEADLNAVEDAIQAHIERGQGYVDHGMWTDAIAELSDALSVAPQRVELMYNLADAYYGRARIWTHKGDVEVSRGLARRCLDLDPSYAPAFALLEALGNLRVAPPAEVAPPVKKGTVSGGILFVAIGLFVSGVALAFLVSFDVPEESGVSHAKPAAQLNETSKPDDKSAPKPAGQIPVQFKPSEWNGLVELETILAKNSTYTDKSYFSAKGLLRIDGQIQVEEVKAKLELLNSAGEVVMADSMSLHASHEATLRPGDTAGFGITKVSSPDVVSAVVSLTTVDSSPAPASYPDSEPLKLGWFFKNTSGLDVAAKERAVSYKKSTIGKKGFFRATWELTNTGSEEIGLLKVHLKVMDRAAKQLGERSWLVVYTSTPPIRPGATRIVNTILEVPASYDHYELSVVEIK